ncbi:hypothetical protein FQN53_004425 [Emmonsiellopsis sp. PD_33]|nr:hypothetical protein FQN53_004425 [Emmonsiellopsis sp. PD_33]KAK2791539.1 hypothetical protein FQN51_002210 [Onygenales sp. PD_10]
MAGEGIYQNPIIPGFNPDPSIIRVGDDYFIITSTFEFFPGIPVYHSKDLIRWELIGHVLTRRSQLDIRTPEPGGGIWAPTIRYHDGTYYVTAANYDRFRPQLDDRVWPRGFYVKTDNIWDSNSWSEPIYFDQVGFDQDLFWDDDGTVYLSTTHRKIDRTPGLKHKDFAIHVCTVDLATGNSTSRPVKIRESSSGVSEGSHILKRGKHYYLFTAEGGTEGGHCEWVCRSEVGPFGPWELGPNNPLWRNTTEDEVQNTGHADLVEDAEGRWWGVFLGVRPTKTSKGWEASVFGRESFLVPVRWENDWPIFNNGEKCPLVGSAPGLYKLSHRTEWRDGFSKPEMELGWYRKNTPPKIDFSLTERPNYLRLYGSPYILTSPTCPTMFLRKQTLQKTTWETKLSFHPTSPRTEAGTVVYWNYFCYSSIGVRSSPTNPSERIIRFRPAQGEEVEHTLKSQTSDVVLIVECGERYVFKYREVVDGGEEGLVTVGAVENSVMTQDPPIGAPFTGMLLGLYAFGELERCLEPADFEYARFY